MIFRDRRWLSDRMLGVSEQSSVSDSQVLWFGVCFYESACGALAVWLARLRCLFLVFPNISACASLLVSGCWFSGHVSNSSGFRSGCNHFLHPRLSLVRPGASTLAPWGPFWQPGAPTLAPRGPFWHLGRTLGDHGSSRGET